MAMNMGPVTITCPVCKEVLPVPAEVAAHADADGIVLLRVDSTSLRAHMRECTARQADKDAAKVVPGTAVQQAHQARPLPAFIPPGNRYCTGCGTSADKCLHQLRSTRTGCCGMCHDGNTHPSPGGQVDCQVWAAEHGATD